MVEVLIMHATCTRVYIEIVDHMLPEPEGYVLACNNFTSPIEVKAFF